MLTRTGAAVAALMVTIAAPASAQDADAAAKRAAKDQKRAMDEACGMKTGIDRMDCQDAFKAKNSGAAGGAAGGTTTTTGGMSAADAKMINETQAKAQAQVAANDFAGAAATYQAAIDANPKSPALFRFYTGQAIALRRQAVAAYNGGAQPTYPPAGATNDQIKAANAANAALQQQKVAAAAPLLRRALESAARAAQLADAQKDRGTDTAIGVELREGASLLYRIDHDAVVASPRASLDTEATWLTRWMDATNPLAESLAARYGFAVAVPLAAKDQAAGLALADKIRARTGSDVDGLLGYADAVVAARLPAGDARRTKALADLTAAEATVTDGAQTSKLKKLKTALAATS